MDLHSIKSQRRMHPMHTLLQSEPQQNSTLSDPLQFVSRSFASSFSRLVRSDHLSLHFFFFFSSSHTDCSVSLSQSQCCCCSSSLLFLLLCVLLLPFLPPVRFSFPAAFLLRLLQRIRDTRLSKKSGAPVKNICMNFPSAEEL